jgi:hypothetical protein
VEDEKERQEGEERKWVVLEFEGGWVEETTGGNPGE